MQPTNLVFILSDQHNRAISGCYGHPVVRTPNLDALAARGVRFTRAYCNCPICVPSRASLATGRYVHSLGAWDNAHPYTGADFKSWGHRLRGAGHHVTTVGKLHYRSPDDDTGFDDQRIPMHILEGEGDLYSLIRHDMIVRPLARRRVLEAGPGESSYTTYDRAIAVEACQWLAEEAPRHEEAWVLFVSFVTPHHPLIAPQEFFDLYPVESVPLPAQYGREVRPQHPVLEEIRRVNGVDDEFSETELRRAIAAYYGLCSFMDAQVGMVLGALEKAGLGDSTRVIYTSDHGDTLGDHGLWWKYTMYEGSAGVPFIMAGPDVPQGRVVPHTVSLVDCFPTVLECVGVPLTSDDATLPGRSLFAPARGTGADRPAFAEYHASSSCTGYFMLRGGRYKYVEYIGYPPQLFDLDDDPGELRDLAEEPGFASVLSSCAAELRQICDPVEVDRQARAAQKLKLDEHGGEAAIRALGHRISHTPAPEDFREGMPA